MGVSRKLFRLFKSFNELQTIMKKMNEQIATSEKVLPILTRLAFLLYWVFDNLGVLIKIKFITSLDMKNAVRRANKFWLLGLVLTIIGCIKSLVESAAKIKAIKDSSAKSDNESESKEAISKLKAGRKTAILNLIKAIGDSTTASQGLGYPKRFLGVEFNDGIVGIGGFTSAFLNCYQQYPAK